MGMRSATAIFAGVLALHAHAQDMPAANGPSNTRDVASAAPIGTPIKAIAGTAVQITIGQDVSSEEQEPGDTFPISLRAPLSVDGVVMLPAGTPGMGAVIVAEAANHRNNHPGKLVLAVRYLEFEGKRIPLRALKVGLYQLDTTTRLMKGLMQAQPNPDIGVFEGAVAQARLAEDFVAYADTKASHALDATASTSGAACCTLAADTLVELELSEQLDSQHSKTGDTFAFFLSAPLLIDGSLVVPMGTPGVGEVVSSAPARSFGRPGELRIEPRYLEFNGKRLPLRGVSLGGLGDDRIAKSLSLSVLAPMVKGGEVVIEKGTIAEARLSEAVDLGPEHN